MKILALETTDAVASVALYVDGSVDCVAANPDKRHAETVLAQAEALLNKHGMTTADMDAFAVDVGPGSFTGVRIGVCLANGLGLAHQKPVIAVNALEALAESLLTEQPVMAIIDARNGNGYGAVYRMGEAIIEPHACVISELLAKKQEGYRTVGTGTDNERLPDAASVARLAAKREGQKQVSPNYLKPSQAERMWNK